MKITVYHGGTEYVKAPLCHIGRPNLDFGQGFYVTDIEEQAYRWAVTIAARRKAMPLVNVYLLDRDAIISEARCKIFKAYDREWLDFIVASRSGQNPAKDYDYIEDGIANDRVIDTVNLYMANLIGTDMALQRLALHQPNNQICLLNQSLIDNYLTYERTESVG